MNQTIAYCILICAAALILIMSLVAPTIIGDRNYFLRNFVNHEFLNVLGVIVAITLASAAQLHLTLNQIEERHKTRHAFVETRANIRQGAYCLIGLFVAGIALVTMKPHLAATDWSATLLNGAALLILLWDILILLALTQAVFSLEPDIRD